MKAGVSHTRQSFKIPQDHSKIERKRVFDGSHQPILGCAILRGSCAALQGVAVLATFATCTRHKPAAVNAASRDPASRAAARPR